MTITSLLITLVGIIVIVALYIMSRIAQSKLPKKHTSILPKLKNDDGTPFTSILDDIPARDGSVTTPTNTSAASTPEAVAHTEETLIEEETTTNEPVKQVEQIQHILFISSKDGTGLDGNLVKQGLEKNGLVFGEMDIYHYMVDIDPASGPEKFSLFRVANGVSPWTLTASDLDNKKLAGLSVVLLTPTKIDNDIAIKTFLSVSENLAKNISGVLMNQQQQPFSVQDRKQLLSYC